MDIRKQTNFGRRNMKDLLTVLELLEKETSLKEKEKLLKENRSEELSEYLDIALNPYRVFYVNKFPTESIKGADKVTIAGKGFTSFKELIRRLERREISGHIALNTIHHVFTKFDSKERKWFRKALTKEAIGVGITTVNKSLGGIIPEFKVMLADNEQPDLATVKYPVLVQPKFDGFRAVYIPSVGFMGRNGKRIRNKNLEKHFGRIYGINSFVLDGELYSHTVGFNEIASILNSEDKEIPEHIVYMVYDGMLKKEWEDQSCKATYMERLTELKTFFPFLNIPQGFTCFNPKEVKGCFDVMLNDGYEGVMLKSKEGLYQWKRVRLSSGIMMKLKPTVTYDLEIIDFEEGEGKYKGHLGKFIVDFQGVKVGVGTGLDDETRSLVWKDLESYRGRIIEVKAMEVTEDKSLRHPVFMRFRDDK